MIFPRAGGARRVRSAAMSPEILGSVELTAIGHVVTRHAGPRDAPSQVTENHGERAPWVRGTDVPPEVPA
ncbi:hypothetical protein DQ384_13515 [Sphaerisporangium album]|uniref:Uncharacterized protein n=2 Tax=Sphaerisporangium album TaxID=509200 RepID=A0A367FKQ4_9ACTN|nr:hypothetical protein DQ384_13515 [Sphaerisporangium album]